LRIANVTNLAPADPIAAYQHQRTSNRTTLFRQYMADSWGWVDRVDSNTVYYRTVSYNGHTNTVLIPWQWFLKP
jgi:hypothetical protein